MESCFGEPRDLCDGSNSDAFANQGYQVLRCPCRYPKQQCVRKPRLPSTTVRCPQDVSDLWLLTSGGFGSTPASPSSGRTGPA